MLKLKLFLLLLFCCNDAYSFRFEKPLLLSTLFLSTIYTFMYSEKSTYLIPLIGITLLAHRDGDEAENIL